MLIFMMLSDKRSCTDQSGSSSAALWPYFLILAGPQQYGTWPDQEFLTKYAN